MLNQNKEIPQKSVKKRRKKSQDTTYRPYAPRNVGPDTLTTEGLVTLMDANLSPAKKGYIFNTTGTAVQFDENMVFTTNKKQSTLLLSPSKITPSTPEKGPLTTYVSTPKGSKLRPSVFIECDDGVFGLFISEDKVHKNDLTIPKPNTWVKQSSPVPAAHQNGCIDWKITKSEIKKIEAQTKKRKKDGMNPRGVSQNSVMKISANQALRKAGFSVEDGTGQWVHFAPNNFFGDKSQCVENLGLGTRFSNAAMELVFRAIRRLLYKNNAFPAIYLSVQPEFVPGFENIRLLKSLKVILKDAPGDNPAHKASIKFNTLSLARVCLTDVNPVKQFILNKFSDKPKTAPQAPASPMPKKPVLTEVDLNLPNLNEYLAAQPVATNPSLTSDDDWTIKKAVTFSYSRANKPIPESPTKTTKTKPPFRGRLIF